MPKLMSPIEALEKLMERSFCITHREVPGAVVERAPKDIREAIAHLTSDDTRRMRPDWIVKS